MKLKEGMYVRTEEGEISKIEWITFQQWEGLENTVKATFWLENNERLDYPIDNFKASFNLIDLVKKGDYVNGYPVVDIMDSYDTETKRRINRTVYIDKPCAGVKIGWTPLLNGDIKDIVTKEQFNACKYVVERDNHE